MEKQKFIPVITALLIAAGSSAFALDCTPSSYIENGRQWINLEIEGDNPFEEIAVRVVKPGKTISEGMSFAEYKNSILAMTTVTTDGEKKAARAVCMPANMQEGVYTIDLVTSSGERASQEYEILSSIKILEKFNIICRSKQAEEILSALASHGKAIGLTMDTFNSLSDGLRREAVQLYMKNRDASGQTEFTVEQVQKLLDEGVTIAEVKNTPSTGAADVFEKFETILRIKELDLYEKYMGFSGAKPEALYQRILAVKGNYSSVEQLREEARIQILLYYISSGDSWYNTREIIKTHYSLLGLTASDINNINESKESAVYQKINGMNFKDKVAFVKGFRQAVSDAEKGSSSSNNKPSGGNSGGGGGGSYQKPVAPVQQPESTPAPEQKEEDVPQSIGFSDVARDTPWAAEAINVLCEKGVVNGRSDSEFAPNDTITREEFTKMIVLASGDNAEAAGENLFTDTDPGAWYYPYIRTAYDKGIVKGIEESVFGIGERISRQDMAVLIYRMLGAPAADTAAEFSDMEQCAEYALDAVAWLKEQGVVTGREDNSFRPLENATRAEAAQMLYRTILVMDSREGE